MLAAIIVCTGCGGSGTTTTGGTQAPTPTPTPADTVTVTFTSAAQPAAAATQIGSGVWTAAPLQNNTVALSLPHGTTTYGVAYSCSYKVIPGPFQLVYEFVIEANVADGTAYDIACPVDPSARTSTAVLSGNVDAIPGTVFTEITTDFGLLTVGNGTGNFNVDTRLYDGVRDIALIPLNAPNFPLAIKIVRNQTIPGPVNGGDPIVLAASDEMTTQTISVTGIPTGYNQYPSVRANYVTAGETQIDVGGIYATQYAVVPASEAQAGDRYVFTAEDADENLLSSTIYGEGMNVSQLTTTAGPVTMALPAPWNSAVAPGPAQYPNFQITYAGFTGIGAEKLADTVLLSWSTINEENTLTVVATAAYLNGSTTVAIPNLSSVPGFSGMSASGSQVYWTEQVTGGTYFPFEVPPISGSQASVNATGYYTQP